MYLITTQKTFKGLILSCICVPAVLSQHWFIKEEDICNQQRNLRVEQNDPETTQTKEELGEPELQQIKEEQEEREPQQTKEEQEEPQTIQIKETYTLIEISTFEGHVFTESDENNQQSFTVTDDLDEEGNQHEESTSTPDEETEPQNRHQRKKRDRSHVQSVASSHMSESQCDPDVRKKFKKATLVKKTKQSPKEKRLSNIKSGKGTRTAHKMSAHMKTKSDEGPYVCEECGKNFGSCLLSYLKTHMRTHRGEKPLCKCDRSFSRLYNLKSHMIIHTGEKPFTCKECDRSFNRISNLKSHMITHTGEKTELLSMDVQVYGANLVPILYKTQIKQILYMKKIDVWQKNKINVKMFSILK
uniref:C2H2-type domain-containing protein n=1 Tax=Oryzias melastigma TaxID=30732 RepID=A0A3B3CZS3_ORYME